MNVLAFSASNSRKSINKLLVTYASSLLEHYTVEVLDINDYEMPIYSSDLEEMHGIPNAASRFLNKIAEADALLISFAEHNGNYTVAFKNLFDWASRKNMEVYQSKPIVLLSTSPGPGGASSVLRLATESAHFFKGNVLAFLSIPSFYDNFDLEKGELTNLELLSQLKAAVATIENK
ncbi:NADPH-dependent FMN reductase [Thalassotalea euphylliae]|uniref:NADPH-dependent FMN reductase n=1 Tax=Thalassotalea euphylliae TaxID=1655234 RepID=UPI0036301B03